MSSLLVPQSVVVDTTPVAAHLRRRIPTATFMDVTPGQSVEAERAAVARAHAIINPSNFAITPDLLDAAPLLRIVANVARGFDNLDPDDLAARGIWATNVPDAFTNPTAEVAMGLILMLARRLNEGANHVRNGQWTSVLPTEWDGFTLAGKTIGIVGYGHIGQAVARRARAFDMRVIYHQRTEIADSPDTWLPLHDLLATADIVSLHTPLTTETHHLLDARALASMKSGALLINTGRGSLIDEAALTDALESGQLGGAGLDVVEREPHVSDRLRLHPRVIITPHLGGSTVESHEAAQALAIDNVIAVLSGGVPIHALNDPRL